jgi:predicted ATPase/DNA-binding SARP family transcriptional activator
MRVDIRLLGGFEVLVDGQRIPDDSWRRHDPAALVKLLALSRGQRLPREQVLDVLWPELLIEQGAPRLHKAAHFARNALGHSDSVVLSGDAVSLFPFADVAVDVERFDQAASAAGSDDGSDLAAEAVEQYRGDLLPDDLYEPWADGPRDRLRLRYLRLLHALERWEQVVEADPVDEHAHLQLVQDHLRRRDRRAALGQLEHMEKVMLRELGTGLSEAALALRNDALAMPLDDVRWESRAARHAPIPRPRTPMIGRDRDAIIIIEMLERSPIVTLLGPGGVGKTRLAVDVALRRVEATSVEGCFIDLARVSDSGLVPELIARELGIHIESASHAERALEEALSGRSMLIVLDNFEHVADAAGIVGHITRSSPDIKVLSTSRARLHIAGEHVFDVAPLSVEPRQASSGGDAGSADAVALFEQAAMAVDPHFQLAPYLADVVSICRTVDGLPLAIELAAGHLRTLPPPLLRARLAARLGSPTAAARDTPPRQHTISATIDWSLQLLGAAEHALFARLGVFAGAVPLHAIETVCGEPGKDVVDGLSRLVDQSLVRRVAGPRGEPRFTLLELLRDRARELLAGDAEVDARDRHAAYFASFLDDADDRRWSNVERWVDEITEMLGDIRAAHAWAEDRGHTHLAARIVAGMGPYWHREGRHVEGRQWVGSALAHAGEFDDLLVARLRLAAGIVEWPVDQETARAHLTEVISEFRALGHDRYLCYALALASVTYIGDAENYDVALALCDEGIGLARQLGERPLMSRVLNMKGELARVHGDDETALAAYEQGRDLAAAAGDDADLGAFLGNLSFLAIHRGEHQEARRLSRDALRRSWSLGRRKTAAGMIAGLAGADLGLGRYELGARLLGAADEALVRLGVGHHPCDIPEHGRAATGLREQLGEETFDRLHSEGARLSLDQAVGLALAEHGDTEPDMAAPAD